LQFFFTFSVIDDIVIYDHWPCCAFYSADACCWSGLMSCW